MFIWRCLLSIARYRVQQYHQQIETIEENTVARRKLSWSQISVEQRKNGNVIHDTDVVVIPFDYHSGVVFPALFIAASSGEVGRAIAAQKLAGAGAANSNLQDTPRAARSRRQH